MQPLDPNSQNQEPPPPQVPQSPYSTPQSPFNAPQPPFNAPQPPNPYGGQQPGAPYGPIPGADKKLPAGLCGILLGGFGVHKFVLGYNTEGFIMLAASIFTCGFGYPMIHLIGIIEGIVYLTKPDQQFVQEYVQNKKPWF